MTIPKVTPELPSRSNDAALAQRIRTRPSHLPKVYLQMAVKITTPRRETCPQYTESEDRCIAQ